MASVLDLVAKITLDTTEYDKGLDNSKSKAETFGDKLKSGFGAAAGLAVKGVTAASGALTAFGATSVKTGMSFDTAMSQVGATMGKTTKDMENEVGSVDLKWGKFTGNLRDYAQEMGAKTSFSATQAAEALNYMALAGYNTQESMNMLPNVLNLAAAGSMDLGTASDMVTDAQTALGISMEETNTLVDQMAKTSSTTNTSVSQLGSAILTIGATARSIKGGTNELNQVLGVLADNGIKGAEGGTHLRNMILSLQTPTKSGTEALKQLGMSYKDMYNEAGELRSLPEIFEQMQGKMEGMTQQSKDAIVSGIFNKTDLKAVNALIGTSSKRWDEVANAIANAEGAAQQMADTQLDNLGGDITIFKSALEGAQIALSDEVTPALRDFVKIGSEGLSTFTDKLKNEGFASAVASLGTYIGNAAAEAVNHVPELISAGAQLLAGIATGLMQNKDSIIQSAMQVVMMLYNGIKDNAPKLIESAITLISNLGDGFVSGIPQFLEKALPLIEQFTGWLHDNAGRLIEAGLGIVQNIAQGIANSIPTLVEHVPQIIINIANIINDNAPKILQTGVQIIVTLVQGLINAIPTIVANIPKIIQAIVSVWSAFNWINLGKSVITAIKNGFNALKTELPNTLKNIGNSAVNFFKSIDWLGLGKTVITAIGNGITGLITLIPQLIGGIASTAFNLFKSVDWLGLGSSVITAIGGGITKLVTLVPDLMGGILGSVTAKFSQIDWIDIGKGVIDKLYSGISSIGSSIADFFGDIVDDIKDLFDFEWKLPELKLPHIVVERYIDVPVLGTIPDPTSMYVDWYRKAYEQPYMFTEPTVLPDGRGFGDGPGGEIVYGRNSLMRDIRQAVNFDSLMTFLAQVVDAINKIGNSIASLTGSVSISEIESIFDPVIHNAKRLTDWEYWDWFSLIRDNASSNTRTKEAFTKKFLPAFEEMAKTNNGPTTFAPTINVYTQEGQSNREIAEYVMEQIRWQYERAGKVFA